MQHNVIEAIRKVYMVNQKLDKSKTRIQINDNCEIETIAGWMLETDGTSFKIYLATKDIDLRRTYTNDVVEIFDVFSIDAVRKAIEYKMNHIISFDGSMKRSFKKNILLGQLTKIGTV